MKDATYHIYNRGIRKEVIFFDDECAKHFIAALKEAAKEHSVLVHAYCVMGTHYHILATTLEPNISEFMHKVQTAYAAYMVKRGWVGHIFAGRFEAQLVKEGEYLLTLTRYIHLNPVRASMVSRPEEYPWSTYRAYAYPDAQLGDGSEKTETAGGFDAGDDWGWIEKSLLLGQFDPDPEVSRVSFREYVLAGLGKPCPFPREKIVARAIFGSEYLVDQLREIIDGSHLPSSISGRKLFLKARGLTEVYEQVLLFFGLETLQGDPFDVEQDRELLREARRAFIYLAREHTIATNGEIARMLGDVLEAAVSRQYGKLCKLKRSGSLGLNNRGMIELDEMLRGKVKEGSGPGPR